MGKAELLLRLSVSRNLVVRLKTGLWMDPARFDKGVFSLPKDPAARAEIRAIEDRLIDIERFLINLCEKTPADTLTKDFVVAQYDLFLHPKPEKKKRQPREPNFFDTFEDYIEKKNISEWRIKHLRVLKRALMRYELFVRANGRGRYKIKLDEFTVDDVNSFEKFLRSEHEIHEKYPEIYKAVPADTHTTRKKPKPHPKGDNTIIGLFGLMRAFYRWCREQELTTNDPFAARYDETALAAQRETLLAELAAGTVREDTLYLFAEESAFLQAVEPVKDNAWCGRITSTDGTCSWYVIAPGLQGQNFDALCTPYDENYPLRLADYTDALWNRGVLDETKQTVCFADSPFVRRKLEHASVLCADGKEYTIKTIDDHDAGWLMVTLDIPHATVLWDKELESK